MALEQKRIWHIRGLNKSVAGASTARGKGPEKKLGRLTEYCLEIRMRTWDF